MSKRTEKIEDSDDAPLLKRTRPRYEAPVQESKFCEYISQFMPPDASLPSRVSILHLWSSRIHRELPNSWKIHLGAGRPTEKTLLMLLAYLCGTVQPSPCALCTSNKRYGVPNNHGFVPKDYPFPFCVVVDEARAWAIERFVKPAVNENEAPQQQSQSQVYCNQLCRFYPASTRRAAMRPTRSPRNSTDVSFVLNSANSQPEAMPAISDSDEEEFEEQLNQLAKTKKKSMPMASRLDEGQPSQLTKRNEVLPAISDSDEQLFAEQLGQLGKTKKRARRSSDEWDEESSSSEGSAPSLRTPIGLRTTPRVSSTRRERKTPTKSAKSAENTNMARFTPMTRDRNSGMDFTFAGDVRASAIPHPFYILTGRPIGTPRRQKRTADSPSASQVVQQPNMAEWELAPGHIPEALGDPRQYDAISGPYLTNRNDVPITKDMLFRVAHLTPGLDLRFDPEDGKRRIIAVACGVLHVKLGDTAFQIGANGIWKVEPNVRCSIMNRQYSTAVLHITTVPVHDMEE